VNKYLCGVFLRRNQNCLLAYVTYSVVVLAQLAELFI